eukprot:TRINITY_DN8330_c0_g1_i1.p1 TRINITY_DN8330_c0_g1~~TRINITY_DN8330_c0_g1_i1.p1  ORF type:complete len:260 (+),score=49.30 TRINITY_DN8330_c0_g1_i1:68-847(+)
MAHLYLATTINSTTYSDSKFKGSAEQRQKALATSTTLYVGNLSFYTTEEQIYELFSKAGEIRRIIMGLDRNQKTPCGFCFVEYYTREDAADCIKYINGTRLDDRIIRTDWDTGFAEGRQYGRGRSGGQVRDEYRQDFDPGRGGFSKNKVPVSEPIVPGHMGHPVPPPFLPAHAAPPMHMPHNYGPYNGPGGAPYMHNQPPPYGGAYPQRRPPQDFPPRGPFDQRKRHRNEVDQYGRPRDMQDRRYSQHDDRGYDGEYNK